MILLVLAALYTLAASLQNLPGCLPGEQANIVSQTRYSVPDLPTGIPLTNATATLFTCPSREAPGDSPPSAPIGLPCTFNDIFSEGTSNCTQGPTDQPTIKDCSRIDDAIGDSFAQGMNINIPPRAGVVLSLFNDSCVLIFLNDDTNDTYGTCIGGISSLYPIIANDFDWLCPDVQDGFLGSYHSVIQPGVQNWEWHVATAASLDFDTTA
ncbi:hypothetical protein C8R45DRAFT_368719 [Mycena sanguinolenta]|nr:hypothetical protein C8R45DRAFT_368719 [Mycena sanguinolenta]